MFPWYTHSVSYSNRPADIDCPTQKLSGFMFGPKKGFLQNDGHDGSWAFTRQKIGDSIMKKDIFQHKHSFICYYY